MVVAVVDLTGPKGRIIDAALALATERSWREISLRDIAERAGMDLMGMRDHFSSKGEVLAAFVRAVDDAVLAAQPQRGADDPKRDQLFEIVMARFDALTPYKAALKSISHDASAEPALIRALVASQAWMLEAAGIGAGGLEGGIRVAGLAAVYASVYRTWLVDDDPGQARTMAVLDRRLRRGERTLASLNGIVRTMRDAGGRVASVLAQATSSRAQRHGSDAGHDNASGTAAPGDAQRHV